MASDIKLKDNIEEISRDDIQNLNKVIPKKYVMKADKDKKQKYGFIAQEIEELYPNLVSDHPDGFKGINYVGLIPLLTKKLNDHMPDNETFCLGQTCFKEDDIKKLMSIKSRESGSWNRAVIILLIVFTLITLYILCKK
jgi:hypothetical protein